MQEFDEFIRHVKKEIRENGFYRKKFSALLWEWWGFQQKNADFLNRLDQVLVENHIRAYTKADNIRAETAEWNWFNLRNNDAYITFIPNKKKVISSIPAGNTLKMNTINEPVPTEKLFLAYAAKAKEILICAAYVDAEMATLLADVAKKNNIQVRFVADINFNSNPYNKARIRSKIETVGKFRTLAGINNEDGIMHLKLYVFFLKDNEVAVFNTSANFTAAAWRAMNSESPVTIQTGSTDNTQIAIMVNAAEKIWKQSENTVSTIQFKAGDRVSHPTFGIGEVFKIIDKAAQVVFAGQNLQTVPMADLQLIIDPLQLIEEGTKGPQDTLHRTKAKFLANYIYAQNSLTNEFYDYRIKPVPHQLLALKKAITSSHGGNLLFADDVGLGKTIEAGLVIQNTIRRIGDEARVLIMCPAGLKWQWYEEMKDKFGLNFNIWKTHTASGAEAFSGSFHGNNRLIASYHGMVVGDTEEAILRMIETYDLVVIDECHKFANDATQWWQLTRDMREKQKIGQLLLLSATPHSGDRQRFLNLLHLLDNQFFPKGASTQESLKKVTEQSVIHSYVYRNDKLSVSDFDGKPLFKNVHTRAVDVELTAEEQEFCQLVVEYILALDAEKKKLTGKIQTQVGFVISVYRKMLASSWKNVFRSMQARYKYLLNQALEDEGIDPLFDPDENEIDEREEREIASLMKEMKSKKILNNEVQYLDKIVNFGKALEKKDVDTKISKLLELINSAELANQKIIIFTQYVKTLEIIKKALGGKDYVAEIQGSINIEDRKSQIDKFRNRVRFLVCTEAGGEGINLQFANTVINFDMPWNPARLQQRIGRVWRYGQEKEVKCFNFFVSNSISDQQVLKALNHRINEMVRNFLVKLEFNGVSEELHEALIYDTTMRVMGRAQEDESIESIMAILDDHLREHRLNEAEKRINEALQFVQIEQKDLAPTIGVKLEEIESFYAPRSINFLKQFAQAAAQAFGGELKHLGNEVYEFINLKIGETGMHDSIFTNKKYVFEQGRAGKSGEDTIFFFGFGDDFFNHLIDICRNQSFGGLVAYASIKLPYSTETPAIAVASASATSLAVANERSETYSVCSFISVLDGREISPEHLFADEWLEESPASRAIEKESLDKALVQIFDSQRAKLQAFRHKDFVLTQPTIQAATALPT
jgi:superfamily II DNA or RNA helicase